MSSSDQQTVLTVALIGNPNTGKSTLFGALVGVHQRVGNYPGVTVEKKTGRMEHQGRPYELIDLPGLYSLAPRSRDEMVTVDLLLGRRKGFTPVDAVVCIVDACNLQRNLYLLSQVLELGLPTVVAVNMLDVARDQGISLDLTRLDEKLGVPVIGTRANRRIGISELKAALAEVTESAVKERAVPFPKPFEQEVGRLESLLAGNSCGNGTRRPPRWLVRRLLLDVSGYLEEALLPQGRGEAARELQAARRRLAEAGCEVPAVETRARYGWAGRVLEDVLRQPGRYKVTATDRIDRVLTHRFWGTLVFALVMVVVFQSVFVCAGPLMDWIFDGINVIGAWIEERMAEGALRSLLVDGVIGGVGGVLVFLPQIVILFFFIAVLEDCGYLARSAYLMDRMMVRVGLSGKSFIPMLSSFACAIPAIMAARVIENERDRLTTILVAPLMTCSARLPVYALLIAAFIPPKTCFGGLLNFQGLTLASLYLLGIVTAVVAALVLNRTILRGATPPFMMELPSYKWPSARIVFYRITERAGLFVRCAGTMILAVSIVVWAGLYYPHNAEVVEAPFRTPRQQLRARLDALAVGDYRRKDLAEQLAQLDREVLGEYQRQSLLGRLGRVIEPAVKPLGWDWRIGCAVIASFPAREVVVATLGVIYNLGEDLDHQTEEGLTQWHTRLRSATWDGTRRAVFNIPVALSIMVFFALCAQCAATMVVIKRETNSWRWPAFTFAYMTVLAYLGALFTYQFGMWIGG